MLSNIAVLPAASKMFLAFDFCSVILLVESAMCVGMFGYLS